MKKISKILGGVIIIVCLPLSLIFFEKNSLFVYTYFTLVIAYFNIILNKERNKMGIISFSMLGLSLVVSFLNLSGLSKIISNFSFIGAATFIICDYFLTKD